MKGHNGIDIGGYHGELIYAVERGEVTRTQWDKHGYGHHVRTKNTVAGNEWTYAHLDKIYVSEGDRVEPGQVIGTMDSTGDSTGTHLHLQKRRLNKNGTVKNWINGYFGSVDFTAELRRCFLGEKKTG